MHDQFENTWGLRRFSYCYKRTPMVNIEPLPVYIGGLGLWTCAEETVRSLKKVSGSNGGKAKENLRQND
ncbi:hypothetical protein Lal_00037332 [Lupinus albus]|nr:hypothetical protein Lal_00037332 [Lupinus albus]